MFQDFYYEYCSIKYDLYHSDEEERQNFDEFVREYGISDKEYLTNIMEILNDILYNTVFDRDNIQSWAKNHPITFEKVLFQGGNELDEETADFLFTSYIQPLINDNVPAKHRIKLANRNYMNDYDIPPHKHDFFYFINKFTKTESFTVTANSEEVKHNKHELSNKVIEKLTSKAVDSHGGSYNAVNFQEIMERIKI